MGAIHFTFAEIQAYPMIPHDNAFDLCQYEAKCLIAHDPSLTIAIQMYYSWSSYRFITRCCTWEVFSRTLHEPTTWKMHYLSQIKLLLLKVIADLAPTTCFDPCSHKLGPHVLSISLFIPKQSCFLFTPMHMEWYHINTIRFVVLIVALPSAKRGSSHKSIRID